MMTLISLSVSKVRVTTPEHYKHILEQNTIQNTFYMNVHSSSLHKSGKVKDNTVRIL